MKVPRAVCLAALLGLALLLASLSVDGAPLRRRSGFAKEEVGAAAAAAGGEPTPIPQLVSEEDGASDSVSSAGLSGGAHAPCYSCPKYNDKHDGIIEVTATGKADVLTDAVKATVIIDIKKYAEKYDPEEKVYPKNAPRVKAARIKRDFDLDAHVRAAEDKLSEWLQNAESSSASLSDWAKTIELDAKTDEATGTTIASVVIPAVPTSAGADDMTATSAETPVAAAADTPAAAAETPAAAAATVTDAPASSNNSNSDINSSALGGEGVVYPEGGPDQPKPDYNGHNKPHYDGRPAPTGEELKQLMLHVEREASAAASKLTKYLNTADSVVRVRNEGIVINTLFKYSDCNPYLSSVQCVFHEPIVVGYQATARFTFEVNTEKASEVIVGCLHHGGSSIESLVNIASDSQELAGEKESIALATSSAIKHARAALSALSALKDPHAHAHPTDELVFVSLTCVANPYEHLIPFFSGGMSAARSDFAQQPQMAVPQEAYPLMYQQLHSTTISIPSTCILRVKVKDDRSRY